MFRNYLRSWWIGPVINLVINIILQKTPPFMVDWAYHFSRLKIIGWFRLKSFLLIAIDSVSLKNQLKIICTKENLCALSHGLRKVLWIWHYFSRLSPLQGLAPRENFARFHALVIKELKHLPGSINCCVCFSRFS